MTQKKHELVIFYAAAQTMVKRPAASQKNFTRNFEDRGRTGPLGHALKKP